MISLCFVILAGFSNSIMDTLKFRFFKSVLNNENAWYYKYVEPKSWQNKWKNRDNKQGEAFWLSSTVLVFITDLWHFAQMIMKLSFIAAIVFYQPMFTWYYDLVIYSVVFSLIFEISFSKILIVKS